MCLQRPIKIVAVLGGMRFVEPLRVKSIDSEHMQSDSVPLSHSAAVTAAGIAAAGSALYVGYWTQERCAARALDKCSEEIRKLMENEMNELTPSSKSTSAPEIDTTAFQECVEKNVTSFQSVSAVCRRHRDLAFKAIEKKAQAYWTDDQCVDYAASKCKKWVTPFIEAQKQGQGESKPKPTVHLDPCLRKEVLDGRLRLREPDKVMPDRDFDVQPCSRFLSDSEFREMVIEKSRRTAADAAQ